MSMSGSPSVVRPDAIPGRRQMALTTGELVRHVSAKTFQVVGSGALLVRLR